MQEWVNWFKTAPLDEELMEKGIKAWKEDFKACDFRKQEATLALLKENTRANKKKAKENVNGAWKAHLASTCGRYQLAIALLRYPPAAVDTLLENWRRYTESDQYRKEKERAKQYRPEELTPELSQERQKQEMLKTETQRLRKLRRRMMYYARQIDEGVIQEVRAEHRKDFERFRSSALD